MALPVALQNLTLPVIGSPMFIASGPALVAAQCKAGIVGSFPALNARPAELLDTWLTDLQRELADYQAANPGARVGPIALSGSIATGDGILAAQAMGADFAYMGSRWLATRESNVTEGYREAIIESSAADVVYTNLFTGVHGNYLKKSIVNAGLDPDALPESDKSKMSFGSGSAKAWRDIWGAGQGVGMMDDVPTVAEMVERLKTEYAAARARLALQA